MDIKKISNIKRDIKRWFGKDRKTRFRKTNPNNRYFMGLIKKEKLDFLSKHGEEIKRRNPEIYYSMIGRKLPKKYQEVVRPILVVKNEVKVDPAPKSEAMNELQAYNQMRKEERERETARIRLKQKQEEEQRKKEVERLKKGFGSPFSTYNEKKYISWCDPYEPVNKGKLGSSQPWKYKKPKSYY